MKKVLSFVLSVAMVICLMPVMAFAADEATATGISQFSDADSINNKEAVAVLVGLGIIDGMGDGTFQPQGDLTRAQASKLVATLSKSGDKSDIPAPAADPFTDVAKSHWAAGAVKFGVDNGYINGMGDGTFHPDDQVTTAQLATMLEKILGYTSEDVNYNWPDNAMAYAATIELLENIAKGSGEALNREEAAQMIFNALKKNVVVKQSVAGSLIVNYTPVSNTKYDYADSSDNTLQLVEKYFPKATYMPKKYDAFGHEAIAWMNGRTKITDEAISNPAYVYTAKMTEKDLKSDLDGYKFTVTDGAVFNGDDIDAPTDLKSLAAITGNGKAVELYTNAKDTEITKIIASDYSPAAVEKVDAKAQVITLDNGISVSADDEAYDALSSLKAGTKVLVAINEAKEVLDAYAPTETTGAITKITTKGVVTVGGKEYSLAETAIKDAFKLTANENGTTYLDKYGYAEDYAPEEAAELEVADWLLVKDVYSITSTSEADKYGEGSVESTKYYVLGVTETGEVIDLELNTATDDKKGATKETKETAKWATAALANEKEVPSANGSRVKAKFYTAGEGELVTYVETADGYTIAKEDPSNKSKAAKTADKVAAKATVIGSNYVSTDVKTIKVTGKKASEVAATAEDGLAAVPKDTSYVIKKSGKNDLVTTVFAEGEEQKEETPEVVVIKVKEKTADVPYTDKNGKAKNGSTISYYDDESADPKEMTVTNTSIEPGWYTYEEAAEDVYTLTAYKSGSDKVMIVTGTIESTYNGIATIDGVTYNVAGDAAVRDLRQGGTAATVNDLEPNMTVEIAYTTDEKTKVNTITQLYVTGVKANDAEGTAPAAN